MKKYVDKESRLKVSLPINLYEKLDELSIRMGMPKAKIALLMVADTVEYGQEPDKLTYNHSKRRKCKDMGKCNDMEKEDMENKYRNLNIPINSYLKNCILNIGYNSFNEYIIDSIEYQMKENFKNIVDCIIRTRSKDKRIFHTRNRYDKYKENHKPIAQVKTYLQTKAKQYDTSENALIMYYASKEINRILSERNIQADIYQHPDKFDD